MSSKLDAVGVKDGAFNVEGISSTRASANTRWALLILKACLRILSAAALILYLWYTIVFCLPSWSWEYRTTPLPWWEWFRGEHYVPYHSADGAEHELHSGWDVSVYLFWWLPLFVAAVCAYGAAMLPDTAAASSTPQRTSFSARIVRAFAWQLPPRGFWLWACDGMNVGEALAVAAWIVVHAVCLWDFVINYYAKEGPARSEVGFRTTIPRSVQYLEWISYSFAWLSFMDFAFLFLPISHNGFLAILTGLPFSALIRYHRWIGHSTMWMIALHGIFFYYYWIANPELNFWEEFFDWGHKYYINVFAGSISFIFGLVLWITSLNWVRRNYFEVFYKTHLVGFIGFIFFAMVHYGWMWTVFTPGLVLYAADYIVRIVQGSSVVTAQAVYVSDDDRVAAVELPAVKDFSKCPIQDIFLLFPTISRWQWHPFTIMARSESGSGQTITVAMKSYGKWTQEVMKQLRSRAPVPIRVNGAFDGVSVAEVASYDHLLMLGGGIGATPLVALLQEIAALKAAGDAAVAAIQQVQFVWVARTASELSLLPEAVLELARSAPWLSLHLHHTGSKLELQSLPSGMADKGDDIKGDDNIKGMKALGNDDAGSNAGSSSSSCAGMPCPEVPLPDGGVKLLKASPYWWNVARPMEPHGHLLSMLTVAVSFLGAFFGISLGMTASHDWADHNYTRDKYYKVSIIQFFCILIQAVGLPMVLVVLPWHFFTRRRAAPLKVGHTGPSGMAVAAVQANGAVGFLESGLSAAVKQGRPDLRALLEPLVSSGKAQQMCMYCAGPDAMVKAAALLVWELNDKRQAHHVYVDFKKYAYEL